MIIVIIANLQSLHINTDSQSDNIQLSGYSIAVLRKIIQQNQSLGGQMSELHEETFSNDYEYFS